MVHIKMILQNVLNHMGKCFVNDPGYKIVYKLKSWVGKEELHRWISAKGWFAKEVISSGWWYHG